jgi:hypothetical protein
MKPSSDLTRGQHLKAAKRLEDKHDFVGNTKQLTRSSLSVPLSRRFVIALSIIHNSLIVILTLSKTSETSLGEPYGSNKVALSC